MPTKTPKQERFFRLCSTPKGRKKAKGKCPPMSVVKEFLGYSSKFHNPHAKKKRTYV